jgi:hypothetical protein
MEHGSYARRYLLARVKLLALLVGPFALAWNWYVLAHRVIHSPNRSPQTMPTRK